MYKRQEDIKGLKIRTIQNPVFIDIFNTLGANATPMPFPEVFQALKSKAIDGQETPYSNIYGGAVVLVGRKFWEQLSGADQKLMQDTCNTARDYERHVQRTEDPKLLEQIKAKGGVYTEISPAERARMREMLKPVYDKYTRNLGEDVVRQTLAELDKYRATRK